MSRDSLRTVSWLKAARKTGLAAADFTRVRNADFGDFFLEKRIHMPQTLDENLEALITATRFGL